MGGRRAQRPERPPGAVDDEERESSGELFPAPPVVQPGQAVGTHDPDKFAAIQHGLECVQGFGGHAAAYTLFKIGHHEPGMSGNGARERHSFAKILGVGRILQRILWRDEPPYPVEPCRFERFKGCSVVAGVSGVEGAAIESNALAR